MTASLLALDIADDPTAWARAGFTIADGAVHLGGVVLRLVGPGRQRGLVSWAIGADPSSEGPSAEGPSPEGPSPDAPLVGVDSTDGLVSSDPPTHDPHMLPPSATRHANTATALDHVVISTPDLERTTVALAGHGWSPRRTIPAPNGPGGRLMRFFVVPAGDGKVVLEVIGDPAAEQTAFWGLAMTVEDLDGAVRRLGTDAIGMPKDAVQAGRRIASVRGAQIGISVPLAFMTPR